MSRRSATALVSLCLLACAGCAGGFIAAYVLEAGTQLLGGLAGAAFAALAVGLMLWSTHLLPAAEYVETREPMQPPAAVQDEFVGDLQRAQRTPKLVRRALLLSLLGLAGAVVVPLRSLIPAGTPAPRDALARTSWRSGRKRLMTRDGKLVRPEDLTVGSEVTVFPEGEPDAYYATGILLRLAEQDMALLSPGVRRYTVQTLIAFSKLCTHAGCPVGLYEDASRQLFCPCHQSVFDVLQGAKAVAGPAGRALPQLPLGTDDQGYLIATGDFRGQPGPTYWKQYWRPET